MTDLREAALALILAWDDDSSLKHVRRCVDDLRAALAAEEGRVSEWRSIETAPKDGTAVLVHPATWAGMTCSIATWSGDKYAKKPCPFWSRLDDLGKVTISRNKPPTHWMPMPNPPMLAAAEKEQ